jgi:hypothetical protein
MISRKRGARAQVRQCASHLAAFLSLPVTACALPLSTGAPQSASTVGKSNVGVTAYAEAPTVDLQAATDGQSGSDDEFSPAPAVTTEAAYGLTDRLDLELP